MGHFLSILKTFYHGKKNETGNGRGQFQCRRHRCGQSLPLCGRRPGTRGRKGVRRLRRGPYRTLPMAHGMRCDHGGHGVHGGLLAKPVNRTYRLRFRGGTGQWQVHQEREGQEDGCKRL